MLHDAHRQPVQFHHFECRLDPPRLAPSQGEKALHESREAVDLLEHAPDDFAVARPTQGSLKRHLAHAADRREWRA